VSCDAEFRTEGKDKPKLVVQACNKLIRKLLSEYLCERESVLAVLESG